ncbi:MAG: hypothetical protein HY940_06805 [Gammaproteobacteria bacterium]|nr:hypothetical protein [Gammaproteobacteria bacterium]
MTARHSSLLVLMLTLCACSPSPAPSGRVYPGDPDSVAVYLEYCTACHAAPQPDSHQASDWPAVLERMQQRRLSKGMGLMPAPALAVISDYLQQHAGAAR